MCIEREKFDFKNRKVNCLKECALALSQADLGIRRGRVTIRIETRVELIGRAKVTSQFDLCSNSMQSQMELCELWSNMDF